MCSCHHLKNFAELQWDNTGCLQCTPSWLLLLFQNTKVLAKNEAIPQIFRNGTAHWVADILSQMKQKNWWAHCGVLDVSRNCCLSKTVIHSFFQHKDKVSSDLFFHPGSLEAGRTPARIGWLVRPLRVIVFLIERLLCQVIEDKHNSKVSSEKVVTQVWIIVHNGVM